MRLHGKGDAGRDSYVEDGVLNVLPSGNAEGWGGRQWLHFPEDRYEQARAIVADAIESASARARSASTNGSGAPPSCTTGTDGDHAGRRAWAWRIERTGA